MEDNRAFYQYLLGLKSPWTVSRVELNVKGQWLTCGPSTRKARCGPVHMRAGLPLYDHAEERTWRHLDSCQYQTRLHARIPRVHCGEHGVVQVRVPWAEPRSRFPVLFEKRLAIDDAGSRQLTGATRDLADPAGTGLGGAGARRPARASRKAPGGAPRSVSMKAVIKGHRNCQTLVCDLEEGTD